MKAGVGLYNAHHHAYGLYVKENTITFLDIVLRLIIHKRLE